MQHDADENNEADKVVVLEGREASGGLPVACQPLVIGHEAGGAYDRGVKPETEAGMHADEDQGGKHQRLQARNDEQVKRQQALYLAGVKARDEAARAQGNASGS